MERVAIVASVLSAKQRPASSFGKTVPTSSGAEPGLSLTSKKYRGIGVPALLAYDKAAKPFWFIERCAEWFYVG
jgi:hypothetical protein